MSKPQNLVAGSPEEKAYKEKEAARIAARRKGKPMEKTKIVKLATQHIRTDGGTQPRAELNENTVSEYANAMESGAEFPPCVVFYDGTNNWLADGFHRYFGAVKVGKSLLGKSLLCEQRQGTRRDAILFSVGANDKHGLRRTNADKRRAVETMLADSEWSAWSNNKIAELCNVSNELVVDVRNNLSIRNRIDSEVNQDQSPTRKVERNGTIYEVNTQNIGRINRLPDAETKPEKETPPHQAELQNRAANATIVRDTMSTQDTKPSAAPELSEDELTDEEWLITIPLFEYLIATGGKALILKADALSWRSMQQAKAFGAFKAAAHKAINFNNASTPLLHVVSKAIYLKHPREWGACVKCRAKSGGCSECGYSCYSLENGLTVEQLAGGDAR